MADGGGKRRFRIPRKAVFALGGVMLLATVSGAAAYLLGGVGLGNKGSPVYGLDCTLIDSVSFVSGDGETWLRQYIALPLSDPQARVRTALRVAKAAAENRRADLVLVVAAAAKPPRHRAEMRGNAVGARIVYAPYPPRVTAVRQRFRVGYVDAEPDPDGRFYGPTIDMPAATAAAIASGMAKPYGCKDPVAEAKEKAAQDKAAKHAA
ncbi:MAG: hypothetical protein ACTHJ3_17475 [Pararhizobium sp.]